MYPDELFLGIHLYGVMIALGILACFGTLFYFGKNKNLNPNFTDFVFYTAIIAIGLGFLSAMLFQSTYNYIKNPEKGWNFNSGMTFIGGLIGGVVVFLAIYFAFRKKLPGRLIDIIAFAPCCIIIAHAFGRIGCAFAGCCYGKEIEAGIAMYNHGAWRIPTQLYEAFFLFVLYCVLFYLVKCKNYKYTMPIYLFTYGIFRFVIEFFRADDRGTLVSAISPSQFWSIIMIVASVVVYFILKYAFEKAKKEETLSTGKV
jgi:phosphatidylglycerol:prolipoprotein diacylglycerol transferase